MKKDGTMTAKEIAMYEGYIRATMRDLDDAYTTCSRAKKNAWRYCEDLRRRLGGFDVRVPSANTFQFSYAFKYFSPETGAESIHYETAKNSYDFEINYAQV